MSKPIKLKKNQKISQLIINYWKTLKKETHFN
jgi:hypothetical protein